jgi:AcrR family transcriptional regulator
MDAKSKISTRTSGRSGSELTKTSYGSKKPVRLGRKGLGTKQSLMSAAARLINDVSSLSLTAASISKEAGTSPATFYVYFENVEDILWELCEAITEDTSGLLRNYEFLRNDERLEEDALSFVNEYCEIWSRHGPLLLFRNMEADRGNKRFNQLVLRIALPILEGLTDRIVERASPDRPVSRRDANAEAVVLVGAIDRIAAALHRWPDDSLTPEVLLRAEARVLVRMLRR